LDILHHYEKNEYFSHKNHDRLEVIHEIQNELQEYNLQKIFNLLSMLMVSPELHVSKKYIRIELTGVNEDFSKVNTEIDGDESCEIQT
jgi:hypothetical protein